MLLVFLYSPVFLFWSLSVFLSCTFYFHYLFEWKVKWSECSNIISSNDQLGSRFYQCFSVSLICLLLEAAKLTATHTKLLLFDPLSPSLFLSLKFGWTCKEETSAASIESKEFQNKNSTLRGFSNVQEHFVAHFWLWLWCICLFFASSTEF